MPLAVFAGVVVVGLLVAIALVGGRSAASDAAAAASPDPEAPGVSKGQDAANKLETHCGNDGPESQYEGIYQVLNKESATVMHQQMELTLINREEDLGNEGLKRAKESYNPVELKPSHMLTFGKPA